MQIISILGYDRSGTTFLGSYLANLSGDIFYAGEIDKGIEKFFNGKNQLCSCNSNYLNCSLWGHVFPSMSGPSDLKTVFEMIKKITGAKVVVDSSKTFTHIRKCKELFRENFFTIHVVRNPKGVVLSRKKIRQSRIQRNTHPKPHIAKRYSLMMIYDCLEWNNYNVWTERFKENKRNLNLTYDLFEDELLRKTQKFIEPLVEKTSDGAKQEDHIVWGNKGRLDYNSNIKINHKWETELNVYQKLIVMGITSPVNLLYNYKYKL